MTESTTEHENESTISQQGRKLTETTVDWAVQEYAGKAVQH